MDFEEIVEWFKPREGNFKLGLEGIRRGCALFENVEQSLRCAHVAGTNGKGSTCFKIAKVFQAAGYRVGLYTSPHISSLCERIQINGEPIPEQELARLVGLVRAKELSLSAFEAMTLAAFLWFKENDVNFSVIEVGLGGSLDATNVCCPDISIITSISFDHMEYLGNTLDSIAENKAGIIKRRVPVVIGPRVPREIISRKACEMESSLCTVNGNFLDYDEENSAVAKRALELLQEKWPGLDKEKVVDYRPSCRFEEVPKVIVQKRFGEDAPRVILDVAHNPDGIDRLLKKLREPAVFLCSISRDKDVPRMISSLLARAKGLVCTQAPGERAMLAEDLGKIALDMKPTIGVGIEADPEGALKSAVTLAIKAGVPLVVTGTFYLMDRIKRLLWKVE